VQHSDWFRGGAAAAIVCLLLSGEACGRQGAFRRGREAPGGFDYYVLALSWAPAFCAHETTKRSAGQCGAGRETGFVVHGLWPERDTGRPLENCLPSLPVPGNIVQQILPLIPDPGLIQHEWRAHGSCSGLSVEDYFAAVGRAADRIRIPESYRSLHRLLETGPGEIERKFAAVNRLHGTSAVRVQCRAGEVRGVLVCMTKNLQPRPCSWNVRDCRAGELFMRPPL
jgi:ribonuclease T2